MFRATRIRMPARSISISVSPVSSSSAASSRTASASIPGPPSPAIALAIRSRSGLDCFDGMSDSLTGVQQRRDRINRQQVTGCAQSADHTRRGLADKGVTPKSFAAVRIGNVHFDNGDLDGSQGVHNRNRGMGIAGGVENDRTAFGPRLLNPVDQHAFVIGLPKYNFKSVSLCPL